MKHSFYTKTWHALQTQEKMTLTQIVNLHNMQVPHHQVNRNVVAGALFRYRVANKIAAQPGCINSKKEKDHEKT